MDLSEEESAPLVNRDRGGSHKSSTSTGPSLHVHLYFFPATKEATTIHISSDQVSAEHVCIQAGKKCGILPVYLGLFGLASSDFSFWYPPSHMFNTDDKLQVHFRVRFFFGNWFGTGPRKSYRYDLSRDSCTPVLDCSVIDYLFAQLRSDFIASEAGVSPPLSTQEECLGLAVLDLWRMVKERHQTVRELCKTVSYKSCLPKSHRHDIQRRNRLDRFRIRNTLKRFLKKLGNCSVDACSLKVKYLIELAGIEPSLGSETFKVGPAASQEKPAFSLVRVTGESGIQTGGSCHPDSSLEWLTFCDFQEIIDISIKRVCQEQLPQDSRMVTITRKDESPLEVMFQGLREALSFASLVDGYFRLTTDSSHYFCQDIAPPSILEGVKNHCHGPITSEFAVNKLKKSGFKGGTFLLRQSPKNYDSFFLTVCVQTPLGLDYKDCLIIKNVQFSLPGVQKSFGSLREITSHYQHTKLLLAEVPVKLGRCCPPRPKELTNLIIVRSSNSVETQGSPSPERNKFNHIQFHIIKYEDLKCEVSLGQGSFTRIFKGLKTDIHEGEKHVTEVLLKELDGADKNGWESFFEAASLMSQISHKHILHVYGISVHEVKNIMVQEFVKHGALDLYLKRGRSVSVSWKLDVAKQLASALNFLEEKNIVHGNICAKNLLLAREGDPSQGSSPFIKLSDPGIMLGKDVILDRIPWVAPEVLESPDNLTQEGDKWSFGATVWEIFNNGTAPLQGWDLEQKRQFYDGFQQLPPSQWTELADLISQCMSYQADFRPSCRSIIRQLNSLITSDYVILRATEPVTQSPLRRALSTQHDQTLFEERHLRYITPLGKGNFGSVELCRYDPLGDNTGELVAVKKLQPNQQSTQEDFQKEVKTLSVLHCDYIVKYRGVCYSMGRLSMSLVMEYLPYGSLIGYLENNQHKVNTRRKLLFASQICKGMEYLQTLRYVHRDLAARNILVASETLVKIADFGLTKIIPSDKEYYRVKQLGESPIFWYAPECINESKFSHKSDVWSFGVVLHELFSNCNMNCNPKRLYMQEIGRNVQGPSISMHVESILKSDWRLPAPPHCPPKVYSLMKECWAYNFDERPCFYSLGNQIETIMQDDRENPKG
ncbi:tyrosine-protein kinase JAK2 [Platichthys flesus]|uniref:tyrosine-protein kinase JAK2 n=1 Tax=Platichthys flesus TaxID=8260 RepID=UPI002DBB9ED5|nr:tyrosine-protein kinase JAK2 [Platichthys flesus]XP_062251310.1 tyrosine-protein kinase JAK2 [Platichthys flesus]XP_062251311.1 tyrosine-protein kinase JAK2 [Platichthys flesus]XP_062251312.1 tyrosine-protein kinase JAK2 [Platichthys flesus]